MEPNAKAAGQYKLCIWNVGDVPRRIGTYSTTEDSNQRFPHCFFVSTFR
jgi:hypothetical protein